MPTWKPLEILKIPVSNDSDAVFVVAPRQRKLQQNIYSDARSSVRACVLFCLFFGLAEKEWGDKYRSKIKKLA